MPKYRLSGTEVFNAGMGGSPTQYSQVSKVFQAKDDQDAVKKVPKVIDKWEDELCGCFAVNESSRYVWSYGEKVGFNPDWKPVSLVRIDRKVVKEKTTKIRLPKKIFSEYSSE
ncbi:MAG TPA: hypothetical protein VF974_06470 [Patescibacteria group bacterium]